MCIGRIYTQRCQTHQKGQQKSEKGNSACAIVWCYAVRWRTSVPILACSVNKTQCDVYLSTGLQSFTWRQWWVQTTSQRWHVQFRIAAGLVHRVGHMAPLYWIFDAKWQKQAETGQGSCKNNICNRVRNSRACGLLRLTSFTEFWMKGLFSSSLRPVNAHVQIDGEESSVLLKKRRREKKKKHT